MDTADPICTYENIKSNLIENLKKVDGTPWLLTDYPPPDGTETEGIYTYGDFCPVCKIIRRSKKGESRCKESHLSIVNSAKGDKEAGIKRCWIQTVCYVTCPVKVGEIKRVFLIGQRLEQNGHSHEVLANLVANELKLDMSESEDKAYKKDLEAAFGEVKVLSGEDEDTVKGLINKCKEAIEEQEWKVDFKELELYERLNNRSIRLKKDMAMIRNTIPDQKIKEIQDLTKAFGQVKFNSPLLQERIKRDLLYWQLFRLRDLVQKYKLLCRHNLNDDDYHRKKIGNLRD